MTADETAPVYDERGNVRPRGTKGARPMTYAERVEIAVEDAGAGSGLRIGPLEVDSVLEQIRSSY